MYAQAQQILRRRLAGRSVRRRRGSVRRRDHAAAGVGVGRGGPVVHQRVLLRQLPPAEARRVVLVPVPHRPHHPHLPRLRHPCNRSISRRKKIKGHSRSIHHNSHAGTQQRERNWNKNRARHRPPPASRVGAVITLREGEREEGRDEEEGEKPLLGCHGGERGKQRAGRGCGGIEEDERCGVGSVGFK